MANSNLPIIEKTLTKRSFPQRFWVQWKDSAAMKSLRTTAVWCHLLRYSQSEFPFFLFVAKMNAIENKIPTTLQQPTCLPTMLQFCDDSTAEALDTCTCSPAPSPGCRSRGSQKLQGGHIFDYNVGCMQQPSRKSRLWHVKFIHIYLFISTQKVIQIWTPNLLSTVIDVLQPGQGQRQEIAYFANS